MYNVVYRSGYDGRGLCGFFRTVESRAPTTKTQKMDVIFFRFFYSPLDSIPPNVCVIVTEIYTHTHTPWLRLYGTTRKNKIKIKTRPPRLLPERLSRDVYAPPMLYKEHIVRIHICTTLTRVYFFLTSYRREIRSIRVAGLLRRRRRQSFCTVTIRYRHNVGRDGSVVSSV